jgi:hypothetical protein
MNTAVYAQGDVYWRVPYVGKRLKAMTQNTQIAVVELKI